MLSLPRKGLNPTQHTEENNSLQPAIATHTEESNRHAVTAQLLKLNLYFSKPKSCRWLLSWETKAAKAEGSVYVKYVVALPVCSLPPWTGFISGLTPSKWMLIPTNDVPVAILDTSLYVTGVRSEKVVKRLRAKGNRRLRCLNWQCIPAA